MINLKKATFNSIKNRNPFIDMMRGLAVLGVLSIHTAFWSGENYVPMWFRSLTLLLDVPMFFFVSGLGSGSRNMGDIIRTFNGLWKNFFGKAIFFVIVMLVLAPLLNLQIVHNTDDLLKNFAFSFSFDSFPVLPGSLWYVVYYVRTIIINSLLICCIKPYLEKIGYSEAEIIKALLIMNIVFFLMSCGDVFYLPINLNQRDFFYNIMWLLGAYVSRKGFKINTFAACIILVLINIISFFLIALALNVNITEVQNMKFATKPSAMLPWLFYSLISIVISLYLKSKRINNTGIVPVIVHIGQNSIFYFFAQGISSSIIYQFLDWSIEYWWIRFGIMYLINIIIAVLIAETLILLDKYAMRTIKKIHESTYWIIIKEKVFK